MPITKIQLDLACEKLRKAIKNHTVTTSEIEIKKKWVLMSLTSSNKKRYDRGL